MTNTEIHAYNSGVLTVLALAERTAASMEARMVLKPTRYNFAVEALLALAEEGRSLLKPDGLDGVNAAPNPSTSPRGPKSHGYELVIPAHAEDDGNFGLTDAEIARPSRSVIIGWLSGRYPMLASHWSRIAARMLAEQPVGSAVIAAE
jgi:hypothetical protein